ncbi:MAG: PD-(D/E)XK motif protein [Mesorhizobium sp.]|nr:MAG: PD-(D/E)XK motif protein [Mesorhizobium sp.]
MGDLPENSGPFFRYERSFIKRIDNFCEHSHPSCVAYSRASNAYASKLPAKEVAAAACAGPYLDLVASPQHERVFSPVCREVIEAVHAQGREPWAATDTVIRHWQSAWRATRPQMSQAVQIGLVGELIVLSRVMIPMLGARAVLMWSGADSERHDFIAGALHLEVKTTKGVPPRHSAGEHS